MVYLGQISLTSLVLVEQDVPLLVQELRIKLFYESVFLLSLLKAFLVLLPPLISFLLLGVHV